MRILRATLYPSPDPAEACTTVMRETDTKDFDGAVRSIGATVPGSLVLTDVFEMGGKPGVLEATVEATRRASQAALREANMVMLYYWDAMHLEKVSDYGLLTGTIPAPHLREQDVRTVLTQLAAHPAYRHQTVVAISEDGVPLQMQQGVVNRVDGVEVPMPPNPSAN